MESKFRKVLRSDLISDLMLTMEDLDDEDICKLCKQYMHLEVVPSSEEDEDGEEYFHVRAAAGD